jgi:hypothetical protein
MNFDLKNPLQVMNKEAGKYQDELHLQRLLEHIDRYSKQEKVFHSTAVQELSQCRESMLAQSGG